MLVKWFCTIFIQTKRSAKYLNLIILVLFISTIIFDIYRLCLYDTHVKVGFYYVYLVMHRIGYGEGYHAQTATQLN